MGTTTTNYSLNKPTVGGDDDAWGGLNNASMDLIDTQMKVNADAAAAAVQDSDIGVTVQAYDADTAKTDVAQTYTAKPTFGAGVDVTGTVTADNLTLNGTGAAGMPVGTTAQRPTAATGQFRFNTTDTTFEGYNGTEWGPLAATAVNGTENSEEYTATANQTTFAVTYEVGSIQVYLNGIRLDEADFTATNGTSVVLDTGAAAGDTVFLQAFGTFSLASHYTKSQSDTRYVQVAGDSMTGDLDVTGTVTADDLGIGLTTPVTPLHIATSGVSTPAVISLSATNAASSASCNSQIKSLESSSGSGSSELSLHTRRVGDSFTTPQEAMRIDSSGNVGIGTSSPEFPLDIQANSSADAIQIIGRSSDNIGQITFTSNDKTTDYLDLQMSSSELRLQGRGAIPMTFRTNSTEAMRIDSSGNVYMGATTGGVPTGGFAFLTGSVDYQMIGHATGTPTGNYYIGFRYGSTTIGTIVQNGTSGISYNTSSDYRLKENVVELTGATERLKQLNPSRFNFIADADTTVDGFLAHEVADAVPEAISGDKDAVDADGNPVYQGIDQSKLVPLLTAALQEAITKIETLETKVTALENA